ncbi:MAG TPA: hypothetical protein VKX17_24145 [Planctomycetota bacterium]|nr:hypothetical protein [Planctomycetota bacterium]
MSPELQVEKTKRLAAALLKIEELRKAEPQGDALAQERAAANYLTAEFGISRPLSDRYVAEAVKAMQAGRSSFDADALRRISDLDDKFGASFMVLAHHVEQILKGGKHMSRRFRRWGDPGDVFRVKGKAFCFTRVERMKVSDITDDDIRKEGYSTREEFENMWIKSHPKTVAAGKTLEPNQLCWCHEYQPVE